MCISSAVISYTHVQKRNPEFGINFPWPHYSQYYYSHTQGLSDKGNPPYRYTFPTCHIPDQRSFWTATAARLPQASSTYLLHHRGFGQHALVHNWCTGSWWPLSIIKFCYISLAYLVSCPWPVTVAPFRARFGARKIAEKKHDMAHEETQKKKFWRRENCKKTSTIWRTKKEKKHALRTKKSTKHVMGAAWGNSKNQVFPVQKIMA